MKVTIGTNDNYEVNQQSRLWIGLRLRSERKAEVVYCSVFESEQSQPLDLGTSAPSGKICVGNVQNEGK